LLALINNSQRLQLDTPPQFIAYLTFRGKKQRSRKPCLILSAPHVSNIKQNRLAFLHPSRLPLLKPKLFPYHLQQA